MQIINANGIDHHVQVGGESQGNPVFFANSLGTDLRLWDLIVPHLPSNIQVVRYDKRGHGLSEIAQWPFSMDDLVSDAEALLDAMNLQQVVFVGLSIGGMIAQGLAARRPDLVKAVVLSNTATKMGDAAMWRARIAAVRQDGIASLSDGILERWFAPVFRQQPDIALWRAMLERTPLEGYLGCCHAIAETDLNGSTAQLRMPALAIAGSEDGASPPDIVRATADLIPGSGYQEIPGVGHLPCVEAPAAYAQILNQFLKEVGHV